jgi:hypothetical protein
MYNSLDRRQKQPIKGEKRNFNLVKRNQLNSNTNTNNINTSNNNNNKNNTLTKFTLSDKNQLVNSKEVIEVILL